MKRILILSVILALGTPVNAQTKFVFTKGFKANITTSSVLLKDMDVTNKSGTGISFGSSEKLTIGEHFALQGDFLFHYRTFNMENRAIPVAQIPIKWWMIEVPVYAVWQIRTGRGNIFLGIGPYAGYGLSAKNNPYQVNLYRKNEITGERPLNRWNFGGGMVCGYEFSNGLFVNAAYHRGSGQTKGNNTAMSNQSFSLGLGYRFRLFSVEVNRNKLLWKPF
jgi:hypothetical protein